MGLEQSDTYWQTVWRKFKKHPLGIVALMIVILYCVVGIYAPFLASSKPLVVQYDGEWFFPLFRYLFYKGFYTKLLDLFFNLLIFTLPAALAAIILLRKHSKSLLLALVSIAAIQCIAFLILVYGPSNNPAFDSRLSAERQAALSSHPLPSWAFDLRYMNTYARLNLALRYQQSYVQHQRLIIRQSLADRSLPTLWQQQRDNEQREIDRLQHTLDHTDPSNPSYVYAKASLDYIFDRRRWLEAQQPLLKYEVMPLLRPFHWEDDAGGDEFLNKEVSFWDLTRTNRKDLVAALLFGVRISLVVGILAVALSLAIGLPVGAAAGYYAGTTDIIVSRLMEIWEGMPTFFMLLLIVAITQSKSIFLVIATIGFFGWTGFSRYLRGEFFKQRNLPYIEACRAQGFRDSSIIFSQILPNAIPPILTLLPFAIMGAITSEAGLSFLGLGEENSPSWGVLMDEGRNAFPSESYLLWPPAILLTVLLIAIALVGDTLRDTLDPKMQR